MRFIYGLLFGVLASVIGAILYLAFADGQYLLQLSPRYHEMQSTIAGLKEAKEQRDQLTDRLEMLAGSLDDLTRRFNELREIGCPPTAGHPGPMTSEAQPPSKAPEPPAAQPPPTPPPTPRPRPVQPTATAVPAL